MISNFLLKWSLFHNFLKNQIRVVVFSNFPCFSFGSFISQEESQFCNESDIKWSHRFFFLFFFIALDPVNSGGDLLANFRYYSSDRKLHLFTISIQFIFIVSISLIGDWKLSLAQLLFERDCVEQQLHISSSFFRRLLWKKSKKIYESTIFPNLDATVEKWDRF